MANDFAKYPKLSRAVHEGLDEVKRRVVDYQHGQGVMSNQATLAVLKELVDIMDWLIQAQDEVDEYLSKSVAAKLGGHGSGMTAFALDADQWEDVMKQVKAQKHEGERGEEKKPASKLSGYMQPDSNYL